MNEDGHFQYEVRLYRSVDAHAMGSGVAFCKTKAFALTNSAAAEKAMETFIREASPQALKVNLPKPGGDEYVVASVADLGGHEPTEQFRIRIILRARAQRIL